MITFDNEKCTRCGACEQVCPAMVIEKIENNMEFVHQNACIECYHCVAVCPVGAVECDEFGLDAFKKIPATKPPSPANVRNLLLGRRSIREFKDKEVPRDILEQLVEIASCAPTGTNEQGVQLSIVTDRNVINKVDRKIHRSFKNIASIADTGIARYLVRAVAGEEKAMDIETMVENLKRFDNAEGARGKIVLRGAPVLIVAHCGTDVPTGHDDCLISLSNVTVAANSHGLGATWIGFLVAGAKIDPTVKKKLGVPLRNTIHAAIILGWPKYKYKRFIPRKTVPVKWID